MLNLLTFRPGGVVFIQNQCITQVKAGDYVIIASYRMLEIEGNRLEDRPPFRRIRMNNLIYQPVAPSEDLFLGKFEMWSIYGLSRIGRFGQDATFDIQTGDIKIAWPTGFHANSIPTSGVYPLFPTILVKPESVFVISVKGEIGTGKFVLHRHVAKPI